MTDAPTAASDPLAPQHDIELPNGVVVSGMGGDPEAIRDQIEDRQDERTTGITPVDSPAEGQPQTRQSKRRDAQERINKAVEAQRSAERALEAERTRVRDLEQRISAKPAEPEAKPAAKNAEPTRPKPTEEEVGTKYASYADFVEDLTDWKVEQRDAKLNFKEVIDATVAERIEADRATRSFHETASTMVERGRKAFTDFDAVQKDGPGSQVNLGPAKTAAILRLPYSERVIYEACKDAGIAQELLAIQDPIEFGMRLARFMPTDEPVAKAAPTTPKVPMTNAVAPVQPVGTSSRTNTPTLEEMAAKAMDDYDNSGYREKRRAELAAERAR